MNTQLLLKCCALILFFSNPTYAQICEGFFNSKTDVFSERVNYEFQAIQSSHSIQRTQAQIYALEFEGQALQLKVRAYGLQSLIRVLPIQNFGIITRSNRTTDLTSFELTFNTILELAKRISAKELSLESLNSLTNLIRSDKSHNDRKDLLPIEIYLISLETLENNVDFQISQIEDYLIRMDSLMSLPNLNPKELESYRMIAIGLQRGLDEFLAFKARVLAQKNVYVNIPLDNLNQQHQISPHIPYEFRVATSSNTQSVATQLVRSFAPSTSSPTPQTVTPRHGETRNIFSTPRFSSPLPVARQRNESPAYIVTHPDRHLVMTLGSRANYEIPISIEASKIPREHAYGELLKRIRNWIIAKNYRDFLIVSHSGFANQPLILTVTEKATEASINNFMLEFQTELNTSRMTEIKTRH